MRNLPITEPRCRGADHKTIPTVCLIRNQCRRHVQLTYDRQLCLPPEVVERIPCMLYPRVGGNECHYWLPL